MRRVSRPILAVALALAGAAAIPAFARPKPSPAPTEPAAPAEAEPEADEAPPDPAPAEPEPTSAPEAEPGTRGIPLGPVDAPAPTEPEGQPTDAPDAPAPSPADDAPPSPVVDAPGGATGDTGAFATEPQTQPEPEPAAAEVSPEPATPPAPSHVPWAWQGPLVEDSGPATPSAPRPPPAPVGPPMPEPAPAPTPPPTPTPDGLADRLAGEAIGLRHLLSLRTLAELAVLGGALGAAYATIARLARGARTAGYDIDRRFVAIRLVASVGAGLWVAGLIGRQLLERVPLIGALLVATTLAGAGFVVARQAVRAASGAATMLTARLRIGDRLTVGDITGTVEHAGVVRVRLRRADGAIAYVPTHELDDQSVVVSSPRRGQAVSVRVVRARPLSRADREEIRRLAALCPYRQARSPIRVERRSVDDDAAVDVQIHAWSASSAAEAEDWLRRALAPPGSDGG